MNAWEGAEFRRKEYKDAQEFCGGGKLQICGRFDDFGGFESRNLLNSSLQDFHFYSRTFCNKFQSSEIQINGH